MDRLQQRDAAASGLKTAEGLPTNTIRALAMDAVEKAHSGHPGTAMAPMKNNPGNPLWPDRDRFILSAGHASMLQYAALHLTGYDLGMEDTRQFRQWGSRTPGYPEFSYTPGIALSAVVNATPGLLGGERVGVEREGTR